MIQKGRNYGQFGVKIERQGLFNITSKTIFDDTITVPDGETDFIKIGDWPDQAMVTLQMINDRNNSHVEVSNNFFSPIYPALEKVSEAYNLHQRTKGWFLPGEEDELIVPHIVGNSKVTVKRVK